MPIHQRRIFSNSANIVHAPPGHGVDSSNFPFINVGVWFVAQRKSNPTHRPGNIRPNFYQWTTAHWPSGTTENLLGIPSPSSSSSLPSKDNKLFVESRPIQGYACVKLHFRIGAILPRYVKFERNQESLSRLWLIFCEFYNTGMGGGGRRSTFAWLPSCLLCNSKLCQLCQLSFAFIRFWRYAKTNISEG